MKRFTLWLVAAFLTFTIGVAASIAWFLYYQPDATLNLNQIPQEVEEVQTVNFCDLLREPASYVGKLVRFKANYIGWWEYAFLYDRNCRDKAKSTSIRFSYCQDDCREILKTLNDENNIGWDSNHYAKRSEIIIVGRVIAPYDPGNIDRPPNDGDFNFEAVRIERAMRIPSEVPW